DGIRDRNVTGVQTCALPIGSSGLPTPAPQKSSTSRQPRRPRRRPATPPTPVNTQKSPTNKQPDDRDDGQHTRPHPRTCSNTQIRSEARRAGKEWTPESTTAK